MAQGVEDAATRARLDSNPWAVNFGQGYRWSAALPAQEFAAFVQCGWFKVIIWFRYNNL